MSLTCNNPILPCNEATSADGYVGELKGLDNRLRDIRPYVDVSCRRQLSACPAFLKLGIPLYRVVRIHGSVGWKSLVVFSSGRSLWRRCFYRFLAIVSMRLQLNIPDSLPLTLSDRAKSCLCSQSSVRTCVYSILHVEAQTTLPSRPNASLRIEVCVAEG